MNKKNITILFFVLFFSSSCAVMEYRVNSSYDKFDDIKSNYMLFNFMGNNSNSGGRFSFDLYESQKDTISEYSVAIIYYGSDWFFIEGGESLVLLIDGERIGLSGEGSFQNRDVVTGDLVNEVAYYKIDRKLIEKIIKAQKIDVKIIGQYATSRFFTPENFQRIIAFYNKYIK